jgi:hypothetical protein
VVIDDVDINGSSNHVGEGTDRMAGSRFTSHAISIYNIDALMWKSLVLGLVLHGEPLREACASPNRAERVNLSKR